MADADLYDFGQGDILSANNNLNEEEQEIAMAKPNCCL